MVDVKTQKSRPGAAILSEAAHRRSRDEGRFVGTMDIQAGTVLAKIDGGTNRTATVTDVGGGKGALTMANPAFTSAVKLGVYKVIITEPASNAGSFVVEDPDGIIVGTGTVAVAFDGVVKFTLADATDFAVGDTALITIADSDVKVTATADGGNAGDGSLGSWTSDAGAPEGVYTLTCIAEAADAGTFKVVNPLGVRLADLTVAVAYTDQINGTIADGSADWEVGDIVTVEVNYDITDDYFVPWNPAGTDGSQYAAAVSIFAVEQTSPVVTKSAVVARDAEVHFAELNWSGTPTDAQKRLARTQLRDRSGIIVRD